MPRSTWKGFLKLSLVSVPIRGFSANLATSEIRLHQLHTECHSRIRYVKTCPLHGEVPKDEIVSGYEYAKGEYVIIDPEEKARLRTEPDRAVTIEAVVSQHTIDPLYFTEKSYYLAPDGAIGQKPFALLQKCLADAELQAVGRVALFGREELVLVRPVESVLAMTALKYAAAVANPEVVAEEVEGPALGRDELTLTRRLLDAFEKPKFSLAAFKDHSVAQWKELIEAKVAGRELVSPPASDEPHVINLMDALKKSVAAAKQNPARSASRGKSKVTTPRARRSKVRKTKTA